MTKNTEQPLLNYNLQTAKNCKSSEQSHRLLVFIHGLFGDMDNLGVIARAFEDEYDILKIDLRNHGDSFHADEMSYALMAEDVKQLLKHLNIEKCTVIGHSMGGKTAMKLADIAPDLVEKLIVIDIAPVAYTGERHSDVFAGLFAVKADRPANRKEAQKSMEQHIPNKGVQQFMLKSFSAKSEDSFLFNLTALKENYKNIMDWQPVLVDKPTLFIKGANSDYIQQKDTQTILAQFPQAKSFVVSNADHWVHAEKPEAVIRAISRIL